MSPRDHMAQMFDAIDADSRRYVMAVLKGEFERAQRTRRPALRLVASGRSLALAAKAPAQEGRNDG